MIPTDKCFGLPIVPRQSGGFELNYKDALKSLTFEGSITLSQAISGQATQTQCLMTFHLIDRDTLPLLYTQVSLHILRTSDSLLWAYFYLKRRRLVKDMTTFITSMLLDPYPNQRLISSGTVCTSCHWFQMSSCLAMIWKPSCLISQQVNMGSTLWVHPVPHLSDVCSGPHDTGWHSLRWS